MNYAFVKMQGCGNDYIYFDCFRQQLPDPGEVSRRLSDRHFGVGGDGVVLICPSQVADARMRMFNADGSEGNMCGNAIRCVGKYLYERGGMAKPCLTVETRSGVKTLSLLLREGRVEAVSVEMGRPELAPERVPVRLPGPRVVGRPTELAGGRYEITCVSMGNPHCVVFGGDPYTLRLEELGPRFENDPLFPERVNTEFVQVLGPRTLRMRVWERGSGETWACGTGACATVVAAVENGYCLKGEPVTVQLRGGALSICYNGGTVTMAGPASFVFEGTVEL